MSIKAKPNHSPHASLLALIPGVLSGHLLNEKIVLDTKQFHCIILRVRKLTGDHRIIHLESAPAVFMNTTLEYSAQWLARSKPHCEEDRTDSWPAACNDL